MWEIKWKVQRKNQTSHTVKDAKNNRIECSSQILDEYNKYEKDMFINMEQCCGHWKNWEKQFFVTKWLILVILKGLHQQKLKSPLVSKKW